MTVEGTFLDWEVLTGTYDGMFQTDQGGAEEICAAPDGRLQLVGLSNGKLLATLPSSGVSVYYPVIRHPFRPAAKAVLMDLDGTSMRSEPFWIGIIEQTVSRMMGDPDFRLKEEDIPYVSGFSVSEHLIYCIQKYHCEASLEEARRIYFEITRSRMQQIMECSGESGAYEITEGLREFLLALKEHDIKIGLVTSGLYEKAMPEILDGFRQMKMGDPLYFYDAVITAGTTYEPGQAGTLGEMCAKPHPWLYREICEVGLGIHEEDFAHVVVLEDSSAGVVSGYLAGFDVIGMTGGNIRESGLSGLTYRMADSLKEALGYILGEENGD